MEAKSNFYPKNFKNSIFVHLFLRAFVIFWESIEPSYPSFLELLLVSGKDLKSGTFP